ncbi:MAG: S-layer homology domain-containing protein, partial [Clostridia bacterium]|nr:S-layer homology domain-containing protein [Clostridia bacterium]
MKKLFGFFLILTLIMSIFSSIGVAAASPKLVEADLAVNGDMELLGTASASWSSVTIEEKIVRSGKQSLKLSVDDPEKQKVSINDKITGMYIGETYTVSVWYYAETVFPTTIIRFGTLARDAENVTVKGTSKAVDFIVGKTGQWTKIEIPLVALEGSKTARVSMRLVGGGTVYFDDVSVIGMVTPESKAAVEAKAKLDNDLEAEGLAYLQKSIDDQLKREAVPGAPNIFINPDCEEVSEYKAGSGIERATGWLNSGQNWGVNGFVVKDPADVYSGNTAIKIDVDTQSNVYMGQFLTEGFEAGQEFVISAWIKVKEAVARYGVNIKAEYYSQVENRSSLNNTGFGRSPKYIFTKGDEWHQIKFTAKIPDNTRCFCIYIIFEGPGEVIIDNAECRLAKPASLISLDSYRTFFYSDVEESSIFATIDNSSTPIEPGSFVEFTLKDENGNVVTTEKVPASRTTYWNFKTAIMPEAQKPYTASSKYCDAGGNVLGVSNDREIYRWDRPKRMDKDGNFIDPLTGEIWYPALGYTTKTYEDFEFYKSIGINTFGQLCGSYLDTPPEAFLEELDWMQEHGVKMCLRLYYPVAGHPYGLEALRNIVTAVKDHPAMYGYMLIDEPTIHASPDSQVKTYEQLVEFMKEGYKAIREIDPNNLVYCLESGGANEEQFRATANCTDVFMIDAYPYSHTVVPTYQIRRIGQAAVGMNKEYNQLTLIKAAAMQEKDYTTGIVTDVAVRHQAYQALWVGAHEFGYIPAESSKGFRIDTSPFTEGIRAFTTTGEQKIIRDHFQGNNDTLIANYQGKDVWMRSWIDETGQMYLVLMNLTTGDLDVELPFVSENGKVAINGFTAVPVNGDTKTLTSADSTIRTTLSDIQVALYKVTPNSPVDTSLLSEKAFDDMEGYDWAADAAEALNSEGIVNSKGAAQFAPAQDITRADFAGFLIRTLGISKPNAENFADVDENHEYAKEIATGKELGIFKGTGNNEFNPDAPISRQDLMTMCYRGMQLVGIRSGMTSSAWANSFSDNGSISDYALEAIAAMIEEEIVKG